MAPSARVTIRIPQNEMDKIKHLLRGNVSEFFRGLVRERIERERTEAHEFVELLQRIEGTDISKLGGQISELAERVQAQQRALGDLLVFALVDRAGDPKFREALKRDHPDVFKKYFKS